MGDVAPTANPPSGTQKGETHAKIEETEPAEIMMSAGAHIGQCKLSNGRNPLPFRGNSWDSVLKRTGTQLVQSEHIPFQDVQPKGFAYHKAGSTPAQLAEGGCDGSEVRFLVHDAYGNSRKLALWRSGSGGQPVKA